MLLSAKSDSEAEREIKVWSINSRDGAGGGKQRYTTVC